MTDRGLPIVDGAPACPFVAFEDDRDGRALAPDHRHRCFAEARPAPRALAHQEAYCLASAFPVCPTFQDWARREAAAARPAATEARPAREDSPVPTPVSIPLPPRDRDPRRAPGTETPLPLPPRRNPQRDWAAPPPWSADDPDRDPSADPSRHEPPAAAGAAAAGAAWGAASRGLAGSAADRLAGPDPDASNPSRSSRYSRPPDGGDDDLDDAWPDADDDDAMEPQGPAAARRAERRFEADLPRPTSRRGSAPGPVPGSRDQVSRPAAQDPSELFGPAWERPRRYEAYPSLRTRVGLPSMSGGIPRLGVAVIALVVAGLVLFFVGPMILGIGGKDAGTGSGGTPRPTAGEVTASPEISPVPAPTAQVYIVVKGDLLSTIAKKFGVTVEQIMAANPQVKNPDKIKIGDELTIPLPVPEGVPNAGEVSAEP